MAHRLPILQEHRRDKGTGGGDGKRILWPCAVCISSAFVLLVSGFIERYFFTFLFI